MFQVGKRFIEDHLILLLFSNILCYMKYQHTVSSYPYYAIWNTSILSHHILCLIFFDCCILISYILVLVFLLFVSLISVSLFLAYMAFGFSFLVFVYALNNWRIFCHILVYCKHSQMRNSTRTCRHKHLGNVIWPENQYKDNTNQY